MKSRSRRLQNWYSVVVVLGFVIFFTYSSGMEYIDGQSRLDSYRATPPELSTATVTNTFHGTKGSYCSVSLATTGGAMTAYLQDTVCFSDVAPGDTVTVRTFGGEIVSVNDRTKTMFTDRDPDYEVGQAWWIPWIAGLILLALVAVTSLKFRRSRNPPLAQPPGLLPLDGAGRL